MDQFQIERAIDLCYEAVVSPETWPDALNALSVAMNAAAIMFYPKSLDPNAPPLPRSEAYEEFLPDFFSGGWYNNHYRSERGWPLLKRLDTSVIIEHQLATDEERKILPHYNELYLKNRLSGLCGDRVRCWRRAMGDMRIAQQKTRLLHTR